MMTTRLQRIRKRQKRNRHVAQIKDKKAAARILEREKAVQTRKRIAAKRKRHSEVGRVIAGYAVERAKEAADFKDAPPHPWRCEEQKARAALDRTAARIGAYGRPEQVAFGHHHSTPKTR